MATNLIVFLRFEEQLRNVSTISKVDEVNNTKQTQKQRL